MTAKDAKFVEQRAKEKRVRALGVIGDALDLLIRKRFAVLTKKLDNDRFALLGMEWANPHLRPIALLQVVQRLFGCSGDDEANVLRPKTWYPFELCRRARELVDAIDDNDHWILEREPKPVRELPLKLLGRSGNFFGAIVAHLDFLHDVPHDSVVIGCAGADADVMLDHGSVGIALAVTLRPVCNQ